MGGGDRVEEWEWEMRFEEYKQVDALSAFHINIVSDESPPLYTCSLNESVQTGIHIIECPLKMNTWLLEEYCILAPVFGCSSWVGEQGWIWPLAKPAIPGQSGPAFEWQNKVLKVVMFQKKSENNWPIALQFWRGAVSHSVYPHVCFSCLARLRVIPRKKDQGMGLCPPYFMNYIGHSVRW